MRTVSWNGSHFQVNHLLWGILCPENPLLFQVRGWEWLARWIDQSGTGEGWGDSGTPLGGSWMLWQTLWWAVPLALLPFVCLCPALAFLHLMRSGKVPAAYLTTNSRVLSGASSVPCTTIVPSHNMARHFHYSPHAFISLEWRVWGQGLHTPSTLSAACDCSWLIGIEGKIHERCSGSVNPNTPSAHITWVMCKKTMERVGVELTCLPLCSRLSLLVAMWWQGEWL